MVLVVSSGVVYIESSIHRAIWVLRDVQILRLRINCHVHQSDRVLGEIVLFLKPSSWKDGLVGQSHFVLRAIRLDEQIGMIFAPTAEAEQRCEEQFALH